MKQKINNLLIVSGTGRNSGKTTIVSELLKYFTPQLSITTIKISPHEHGADKLSNVIHRSLNYRIYEDLNLNSGKDTGRMLKNGAAQSFYIEAHDQFVLDAFLFIYEKLEHGTPLICESPALYNFIEPGVFIIAENKSVENPKSKIFRQIPKADWIIDPFGDNLTNVLKNIRFENAAWKKISQKT